MVNVQRLSPDGRVKLQANGRRKILTLLKREGLQIVYTLGNASGNLYDYSIRVASNRKYDNI